MPLSEVSAEFPTCAVCGKTAVDVATTVAQSSAIFASCVPTFKTCATCRVGEYCTNRCLQSHRCPGPPPSTTKDIAAADRVAFHAHFLAWQKDTCLLQVLLLRQLLDSAREARTQLVVLHLDYDPEAADARHFVPRADVEKIEEGEVGEVHGGALQGIEAQREERQHELPTGQLFVPLVSMVHVAPAAVGGQLPTVVVGCPHLMLAELFEGESAIPLLPTGKPVAVEDTLALMRRVQGGGEG
jgi:hypothetical protein